MTDQYIITEEQINKWCGCISVSDAEKILTEVLDHPYNPQSSYQSGFDEGFSIGKSQCETHHDEIKRAVREKVLDELEKRVDAETYEVEDRHNCRSIKNHIEHSDVKRIIEELRREGKRDEKDGTEC